MKKITILMSDDHTILHACLEAVKETVAALGKDKNNFPEMIGDAGVKSDGPWVSYHALEKLTKREMEVAGLVSQGFSSKEIASQLDISFKTVEVHRYNILRKLKLRNTAALASLYSRKGIK